MDNEMIVQILQYCALALKILIPLFVIIGAYKINWKILTKNATENLKERVLGLLDNEEDNVFKENIERGYFDLTRIEEFLNETGSKFYFSSIGAFEFMMIKCGCALLFFIVGLSIPEKMTYGLMAGFIGALIGFFGFDWLLSFINSIDNDEMLDDIKAIFDTLRVQTKAGVFLSNSLSECYMIVSNKRLKAALLDATNEIIIKNDIRTAVKQLNQKFSNQYIDTLCITIMQSMESGKSVQILEDLSKQIADMQETINIKEQERLNARVQILEMCIFVGLIGSIIFVLFMSMAESFSNF